MMGRTPIKRVPVKIRKPIHRDFCGCWNTQVFSIDGVPQFINGDKFTDYFHLANFLSATPVCLPIHFTYTNDRHNSILYALSMKIPVTVKTNQVLPEDIVQALTGVPHSGIQVSINFLDDFMRNRLERGSSSVSDLREMLSLAKSWKVFTSLSIECMPHLMPKLDLFEMIDMIKNYISHILISFPDISDTLYHEARTGWEALQPSSKEKFKYFYIADVPTRIWKVKQVRKDEIVSSINDFIKGKKITIEEVEHHLHHNGLDRVRHSSSGLSNLPLGIRPFFYEKSDEGVFKETTGVEGSTCKKCGKPIFA